MSDLFWTNLGYFKGFDGAFSDENFTLFDADWSLFITDVTCSTEKINAGKYKEVNFVGALSIVALINACKPVSIPFVFGGDGAAVLVPNTYVEVAKKVLLGTQKLAHDQFEMDLRVGMISLRELHKQNIFLEVAKCRVSDDYDQAIFRGGAMMAADKLIKGNDRYLIYADEAIDDHIDFSGLECRWQDIQSPKEEVCSLLIFSDDRSVYKEVLQFIGANIGNHDNRTPIREEHLSLSFSPAQFLYEARVNAKGLKQWVYVFLIFFINLLGYFLIRFKIKTKQVSWGEYKRQICLTTDSEKFDDMLRMTCSLYKEERLKLTEFLENQYQKGKLCYGLHVSDRTLMTCLVFERMGSQVHFVDAADGGYALASIELKRQMEINTAQKLKL